MTGFTIFLNFEQKPDTTEHNSDDSVTYSFRADTFANNN